MRVQEGKNQGWIGNPGKSTLSQFLFLIFHLKLVHTCAQRLVNKRLFILVRSHQNALANADVEKTYSWEALNKCFRRELVFLALCAFRFVSRLYTLFFLCFCRAPFYGWFAMARRWFSQLKSKPVNHWGRWEEGNPRTMHLNQFNPSFHATLLSYMNFPHERESTNDDNNDDES